MPDFTQRRVKLLATSGGVKIMEKKVLRAPGKPVRTQAWQMPPCRELAACKTLAMLKIRF